MHLLDTTADRFEEITVSCGVGIETERSFKFLKNSDMHLALFKISDLRQCIDSVCLITNATCFEMFSELVVPFFQA